jgi:hypothetical protein
LNAKTFLNNQVVWNLSINNIALYNSLKIRFV